LLVALHIDRCLLLVLLHFFWRKVLPALADDLGEAFEANLAVRALLALAFGSAIAGIAFLGRLFGRLFSLRGIRFFD